MPPRGGVSVGVTILTWRQYTGSKVSAAIFPAQLNFSVYLQICNYLLLSASHTCFLRGSSQSVCLRIAFECHVGVISGILALLQYCVQEVLPCKSLQSCPVHDWQSHKMHSQDDTRVQVKCLRVLQYFLLPDHLTSHGLQEPGKRLNAHSYR